MDKLAFAMFVFFRYMGNLIVARETIGIFCEICSQVIGTLHCSVYKRKIFEQLGGACHLFHNPFTLCKKKKKRWINFSIHISTLIIIQQFQISIQTINPHFLRMWLTLISLMSWTVLPSTISMYINCMEHLVQSWEANLYCQSIFNLKAYGVYFCSWMLGNMVCSQIFWMMLMLPLRVAFYDGPSSPFLIIGWLFFPLGLCMVWGRVHQVYPIFLVQSHMSSPVNILTRFAIVVWGNPNLCIIKDQNMGG